MGPLKRFGVPAFAGLLTILSWIGGAAAAEGEADLARGEQLYMQVCSACHGKSGEGVPNVGEALSDDLTPKQIIATALEGGERMPPFQGTYSREELNDIAVFITERLLAD